MNQVSRPLSPHLQVYRWAVSNTLSILHRITGVALSIGAIALIGLLLALAAGQASFLQLSDLFRSFIGQFLLLGLSFAFFFHLCNGIRHLAWDIDRGFDKHFARKSGLVVVCISVLLTLAFWVFALTGGVA
jgi:succinate dehydrogenase / fumarate reductase cytochrome b subunit